MCKGMRAWYAVAKNEFRLMTSWARKSRRAILVILVALPILAFSVSIFLGVRIHSETTFTNLVEDYLRIVYGYVGEFEFALGVVDYALLMGQFVGILGFMMPIMGAVGSVFRETEILSKDIILASPLRSRDLLLGRFVANLFIIPLVLTFIATMFLPVFIEHGLNSLATPFILAFVSMVPTIVGVWIGVMLSSYIKTKSDVSPRMRDIGKAVVGMVGALFGVSFLLLFSGQSSALYWTFSPTTWVTNIVFFAVTGTNWVKVTTTLGIYSYSYYLPLQPDLPTSLTLLLLFVALVFYLGLKVIDRVYRIEISVSEVTTIRKENWFFRAVRRAIPSPLGAITAVQLKEFSRSLESITRMSSVLIFPVIVYLFNFMGFNQLFLPTTSVSGLFVMPGLSTLYLLLAAGIIGIMEASQMTVKQRDLFWTYKKAPRGVENLVYSKFLAMIIVGLPIGLIVALLFHLVLGSLSSGILILVPAMLFMIVVSSAIALGIYSARPVFKEQSAGHLVNFLIFMFVAFTIEGIMILFGVFPWIQNIILTLPTLGILLSLPPQASTWLIQTPFYIVTWAQLSVNWLVSIIGVAVAASLGIIASYLSLRIGISKLKKFE